jgi:hypothetical protein
MASRRASVSAGSGRGETSSSTYYAAARALAGRPRLELMDSQFYELYVYEIDASIGYAVQLYR